MSVSIPLVFMPPEEDNIVRLHVFEGATASGPFVEIDATTQIGTWPNYIDHYTTALASAIDSWFAIQWEDDKGALSVMSPPVKGGVETIVLTIMDRMIQRDTSLDRVIALHEAEGAAEWYFNADPYDKTVADIVAPKTYRVLNGLTYLALARSYILQAAIHDRVDQGTIGVLSFRTQSGVRSGVDVKQLVDLANELLELNISTVLQLCDVYPSQQTWQQLYEDEQVQWAQIPWIKGLYTYGSIPPQV